MNSRTTLFRRVALASVVALGVAACGDNVVTVPPTPTLSVSPNSLQILPGQTGQFSVSIGGTDNTAFTVAHSGAVSGTQVNGNVVTVTVAAGATPGQTGSVNVQSSGHPSLAATVQVVVSGTVIPPGEEASVVIRSVTQTQTTTPVNPNAVQGQIDVTLGVTRGAANRLEVALVGANDQRFVVETCTQTFGTTGTAADGTITAADLRPAQNNQDIVCSINTAAASAAGVAAFPNGTYRIEARLLEGTTVLDSAQTAALTFANVDRIDLEVSPASSVISPASGLEWSTGAVTVQAVPVSFSGSAVTRVSVTATRIAGGTTWTRTDDSPADGFSVTFPTGTAGNQLGTFTDSLRFTATSVTEAGAAGPGVTAANAPSIRYDRQAPTGGTEQNFANQWINATTAISADPNWSDAGVGGVTRTLFYSTNVAHDENEIVSGGQQLPADRATIESNVSNAYRLAVRVCDALNNCRNELIGTFGVDVTPPTLTLLDGSPSNMAVNPGASYQFSVSDTRSGPAAQQLRVRLLRSGPGISGANTCAVGNWANNVCSPINTNGPISIPAGDEGYYELTVQGRDAAGNLSEATVTRQALRDLSAPSVSNIAIPAALNGGQPATFTAVATDNLDLGRASFRLEFGGFELPLEADQTLGTFGEPLTREASLSASPVFVRAVEMATGGSPDGSFTLATAARFRVWDLANNAATQSNAFADGTVTRPAGAIASFGALGVQTFEMNTATTTIWRNPTGNQAASATLRARAVGPTGTFDDPFTRLVFYRTIGGVHHVVGEGSVNGTDTGVNRIWTYTGPVIQGSSFAAGTLEYFAVGYTTQGDALVSEPQTITVSANP